MPTTLEGNLSAAELRIAVVASRWNSFVTDKLLEGAVGALRQAGADENHLTVARVPGTWEIPVAAKKLATVGRYDAVVCIGCLIRGATAHFDYLARGVTAALAQIVHESGVPVTYGILTVESVDQAMERSGPGAGNKGAEAALAAVEMANLMKNLNG